MQEVGNKYTEIENTAYELFLNNETYLSIKIFVVCHDVFDIYNEYYKKANDILLHRLRNKKLKKLKDYENN